MTSAAARTAAAKGSSLALAANGAARKVGASNQSAVLSAEERAFHDSSAIVQTSAHQALAELSRQSKAFDIAFQENHLRALTSHVPSMRARARKLIR